jgi:hypothetical protein
MGTNIYSRENKQKQFGNQVSFNNGDPKVTTGSFRHLMASGHDEKG